LRVVNALSQADVRQIEKAAEILRSARDLDGFPGRAFAALSLVIDADLLTYNDVNVETGEARFVLRPRRPAAESAVGPAPFLRRFGYHPAATMLAGEPADSDAIPRFVRDPKLRAVGVGNCCGEAEIKLNADLPLSRGSSRLVGIGVSLAVREFTDRERDLLNAIRPHLVAALEAARGGATPAADPIDPPAGHPRLTRRENEVLYWVAMGKTNEEIGAIIGARPLTVKKHLEHVYEKLEVPNRTAAAVAMRSGAFQLLLPPPAAGAA
jgi:DNA-binding CsgD family transcriptional regulator